MSKIAFFYCTGTSYAVDMFAGALSASSVATGRWFWGDTVINPGADPQVGFVEGLNGKLYPWSGEVFEDPFPFMLDLNVWAPERVTYAASSLTFLSAGQVVGGMGASIDDGVSKVIERINALPPGTPFALGGYSQGAAVMSSVYNELRSGSLTGRRSQFLGGVMFGNPRRQVNHRGEVGGTWSGAWDIPGSNTGGHGSFPATGSHARLSGCNGTEWIEFAAPNDIITSTGDSPTGLRWTQGNDALISLLASEFAGTILLQFALETIFPGLQNEIVEAIQTAFAVGDAKNYFIDPTGTTGVQPGAGHVIYPHLPPPDSVGVIPVESEEVTTTFTLEGLNSSSPVRRPRRGRVPTSFPTTTYEMTQTYVRRPDGVQSCYQIALQWLEDKASEFATSPIVLPSTGTTGWSTTLVPPTVEMVRPPSGVDTSGPKINLYSFDGTGSLGGYVTSSPGGGVFDESGGQYPQILGRRLQDNNPAVWRWKPVDYHPEYILTGEPPYIGTQTWFEGSIPKAITGITVPTVSRAVERAVNLAADSILALPPGDKIVLSGLSQGSLVVRVLYEELMSGALMSRKDDVIGVVNFGDACRPPGRTVPLAGAFDPGGQGASVLPMWMPLSQRWTTSGHYVNPPAYYWAFTNVNDAASCASSTPGPTSTFMAKMAKYVLYGAASGTDWRSVADWTNRSEYIRFYNTIFSTSLAAAQNTEPGTDSLVEFGIGILADLTSQWQQLFPSLLDEVLKWLPFAGLSPNPHALYNGPSVYTAMNNNTKSAVQLAFEHLSQFQI